MPYERPQFDARPQKLDEGPLLARLDEVRDAGVDLLHLPQKPGGAFVAPGEPPAHRLMGGVEADRHFEHVADEPALHRIERRDRNPLDLVEKAEFRQDGVLGIARIARIRRLVQRRLDRQRALLEGRGRPADAVVAFENADLAARLGEQRRRGQPAEARPDDDGVECVLAHYPSLSPPASGGIALAADYAHSIEIRTTIVDRRQTASP